MKLLSSIVAAFALATNVARAANGTIVLMPLGDSITSLPGSVSGCWRATLYNSLTQAGFKLNFIGSLNGQSCTGGQYDSDNEGHAGYQAVNIADQNQLVGWLKPATPDVVMFHLGTNDVANSRSTSQITASFTKLVQQMRAVNPNVKILVSQIIPLSAGSFNTAVVALNAAIPAWAVSQNTTASPIWVVDQYTGFSSSDLADGVHPNASGNDKMAAKYIAALKPILALV